MILDTSIQKKKCNLFTLVEIFWIHYGFSEDNREECSFIKIQQRSMMTAKLH